MLKITEPLGWHTVVYSEADILQEMIPFLEAIPTIIVVDHFGRPDIAQGRGGADIRAFNYVLDSHSNIWAKVSGAERLSPMGPPYDDFVEVIRPVVGHFSDRALWGRGGATGRTQIWNIAFLTMARWSKIQCGCIGPMRRDGAGCRNRTRDIQFTKLALYQLS